VTKKKKFYDIKPRVGKIDCFAKILETSSQTFMSVNANLIKPFILVF
jgi:hypothetical protein